MAMCRTATLIANLPPDCCVEVPCLVDGNGIQPTRIDSYPPQLAALNRTNVNVQELIVHAALTGDAEAIHHAVLLDPLTAAVCTLPQIHLMVGELFSAAALAAPILVFTLTPYPLYQGRGMGRG